LLEEALDRGANVVGGTPDNELTEADTRAHVDSCLDIADSHGVPADMHVDETDDPTARSLEYLATRTLEYGLEDDVTAGHTCALAAYDETHAQRVIRRLVDAELSLVTNPPTNLFLQGRHDQHPKRRGITRVDQLLDAGLTVAAGQDCISDGFYPYGRASMLEVALLTAHAAHLQTPAERRTAWNMVTAAAAAVMGREYDHGLGEGTRAVFNVFPPAVRTRTEAIRKGLPPRHVVHDGRVVAKNERSSTVSKGG
jgi:cytosine deaminase